MHGLDRCWYRYFFHIHYALDSFFARLFTPIHTPIWYGFAWIYMQIHEVGFSKNPAFMRVRGPLWRYVEIRKQAGIRRFRVSCITSPYFRGLLHIRGPFRPGCSHYITQTGVSQSISAKTRCRGRFWALPGVQNDTLCGISSEFMKI